MTSKQRIYFMSRIWPAAADAQGWRRDDRERRLEEASRALGRPVDSFNQIHHMREVDKLFAHFGALALNVKRAMDLTPAGADFGERRRLLYEIRREGRLLSPSAPEAYPLAIARDQFGITTGLSYLEDLTTDQLRKLRYTVHARARKHARAQADHIADVSKMVPEPELANCPF